MLNFCINNTPNGLVKGSPKYLSNDPITLSCIKLSLLRSTLENIFTMPIESYTGMNAFSDERTIPTSALSHPSISLESGYSFLKLSTVRLLRLLIC